MNLKQSLMVCGAFQAVVNAGVTFRLRIEKDTGFETRDYCYENGKSIYCG